jgi:hypothetical protein
METGKPARHCHRKRRRIKPARVGAGIEHLHYSINDVLYPLDNVTPAMRSAVINPG